MRPSTGATAIEISILILALASIAGLMWLLIGRRSAPREERGARTAPQRRASAMNTTAPEVSYTSDAIEAANAEVYRLAFGATPDDQILGEHAKVLERIGAAINESVHQREYFPRRPMLLPKLMQALNDPEVSREALVKLILEDPSIAGGVLQQANSAFYRVSPARVDSVDRAVWLLGTDGLRRLMATAIMQPVFRLPKGHFDLFAPLTWEQAQRAAAAAEAYARYVTPCDAFVAQLLAVLELLARIVIFRLAMDKYRESPSLLPQAEVFIQAMRRHGAQVALRIAHVWDMSEVSLSALEQQAQQRSPLQMREFGRAIYFARLTSSLAVLATREAEANDDDYLSVLSAQGLDKSHARLLWVAALSSHEAPA